MEQTAATDSKLATRIVQSLSCLLKDEQLADFTVIVEDSIYKCHRNILGACSKFFHAMFTADMIEKKDNTARLHDVDSSVFELVLKILYTGENVVNESNVLSIWQCAHRLQIPFLVDHCETLAVSVLSIENFAEFSRVAKTLDSESVQKATLKFILKNFSKVKDDEIFLEFCVYELIDIIQSDELEVTSEDDVLFLIYKWVESSTGDGSNFESNNETNKEKLSISHVVSDVLKDSVVSLNDEHHTEAHNHGLSDGLKDDGVASKGEPITETQNPVTSANGDVSENAVPNNDIVKTYNIAQNISFHLERLLKKSRACLASRRCLQTLYQHRLTQNNERAKAIIFDAILYQMKGYHHGYFPPGALYRNSSKFEHVGIIAHDTGSFEALSLARNKWYPMPACQEIKNKIKIALFDSSVYAVGQGDNSSSKLCVLKESSWVKILELPGLKYFLLSHETFLYVFNSSIGEIHRMKPNSYDKSLQKVEHPEEMAYLEFALSLRDYIIVFSRDMEGGYEETAVHVMNTLNGTWHRLENLYGPAKNMASFQDGDNTYLLQNNGNLWSVTTDNAETITFQFLHKIWEDKESLRGTLLYKGKLFLFLKLPWVNPNDKLLGHWPGVYRTVQKWARNGSASNFVCTVMHDLDMAKELNICK